MNANPSSSTGISLFFATNGYEPQMSFDLKETGTVLPPKDSREAAERKRAEKVAKAIQVRSEFL